MDKYIDITCIIMGSLLHMPLTMDDVLNEGLLNFSPATPLCPTESCSDECCSASTTSNIKYWNSRQYIIFLMERYHQIVLNANASIVFNMVGFDGLTKRPKDMLIVNFCLHSYIQVALYDQLIGRKLQFFQTCVSYLKESDICKFRGSLTIPINLTYHFIKWLCRLLANQYRERELLANNVCHVGYIKH